MRQVEEESGVSCSTLCRIERGNLPDIETFVRLMRWLKRPASNWKTCAELAARLNSKE